MDSARIKATATGKNGDSGRLGGARADFVGSLGRRVADLRVLLRQLEAAPDASAPVIELRRKLHMVGAGAAMLHFDALSAEIAVVEGVLERMGTQARPEDLARLARSLDDLPALAWSDPREATPEGRKEAEASAKAAPCFVALVVGEASIAEALQQVQGGPAAFECEHTLEVATAADQLRALAPDVCVIDADLPGTADLVACLQDDPLTETVPIVVLGRFATREQSAQFVALGVAKTLAKPVAPEYLHLTCEELVDYGGGRTTRLMMGDPTLEQLGERLGEELRRALTDCVDSSSRERRVVLGEGSEVNAAVWGAINRIRELVTARTAGEVRFAPPGLDGAKAVAPWLSPDVPGADRAGRGRGAAEDVRLEGRTVLVVDDDPAVTWFLADLLRTNGCVVHEALNGKSALQLAYKVVPDLVICDVVMPELDGLGLLRLLRRDVALRDTPVILLSWKDDLLQRVRELGADATAYLRKESDARAVVARVREALWPRARFERRLSAGAEVQGRLDGHVTVRTLLQLTCTRMKDARLSVRDASCTYEVEVRGASPVRATRTAPDGSYEGGETVLRSMLGIGAGRFVITPATGAVNGELVGTLEQQLAEPLALARQAMDALCGARTCGVGRVELDLSSLAGFVQATPEPARSWIERLAAGGSPREMLLSGEVDPHLLQLLLADLAGRGAVRRVLAVGAAAAAPEVDAQPALDPHTSEYEATAQIAATPQPSAPVAELAAAPAAVAAPDDGLLLRLREPSPSPTRARTDVDAVADVALDEADEQWFASPSDAAIVYDPSEALEVSASRRTPMTSVASKLLPADGRNGKKGKKKEGSFRWMATGAVLVMGVVGAAVGAGARSQLTVSAATAALGGDVIEAMPFAAPSATVEPVVVPVVEPLVEPAHDAGALPNATVDGGKIADGKAVDLPKGP